MIFFLDYIKDTRLLGRTELKTILKWRAKVATKLAKEK